jgi:hypothetical protein
MAAPVVGPEAKQVQDKFLTAVAPFQAAWRQAFFEIPFAFASGALKFAAQRLQAQSDFIASLKTCQSVPEVIDAQSRFVRIAVGDYGSETSKIIDDMRKSVSKAA